MVLLTDILRSAHNWHCNAKCPRISVSHQHPEKKSAHMIHLWHQWLLSLYRVGVACVQWKKGESFV